MINLKVFFFTFGNQNCLIILILVAFFYTKIWFRGALVISMRGCQYETEGFDSGEVTEVTWKLQVQVTNGIVLWTSLFARSAVAEALALLGIMRRNEHGGETWLP